jgi:hypothetical protein
MQVCGISAKLKFASPLIEYRPLEISPQMHLFNQFLNNTQQQKFCPIIIIINQKKKRKTWTLIDVAIPADRNVVQKEAEKKLKCKSLCIEIQRMWNLKCTIIPVIIVATGIVTRSLRKFGSCNRKTLNRFTTKYSYTSHIVRKVLQSET